MKECSERGVVKAYQIVAVRSQRPKKIKKSEVAHSQKIIRIMEDSIMQ